MRNERMVKAAPKHGISRKTCGLLCCITFYPFRTEVYQLSCASDPQLHASTMLGGVYD